MATKEQADNAKEGLAQHLRSVPWFKGVGVVGKNNDYRLRAYFKEEPEPGRVASRYQGVPVEVEFSKKRKPLKPQLQTA
ncbi:MAG: hypothetical protein K0S38_500 [Candidatus Paceibacter sp.]|jgi:hypothetical protein|nr:hypothetical protein [Candidatus Paceibacter sp.]